MGVPLKRSLRSEILAELRADERMIVVGTVVRLDVVAVA
jgi:hypothetical protein